MRVISGALAAPGPGISAKEPRMSAGLPPRFAANRLHMQQKWPSGRRAIGPGAVSLWLQIRCKCSQTAPATVQLRDGNTPNSAMHCVKGKPVALKIGFAVGSAKVVVPLPL